MLEAKFIGYKPFENQGIAIQFGMSFECPHCLKQFWLRPGQVEFSDIGQCHYCLGKIKINKSKIPKLTIDEQTQIVHEFLSQAQITYFDGEHARIIERKALANFRSYTAIFKGRALLSRTGYRPDEFNTLER